LELISKYAIILQREKKGEIAKKRRQQWLKAPPVNSAHVTLNHSNNSRAQCMTVQALFLHVIQPHQTFARLPQTPTRLQLLLLPVSWSCNSFFVTCYNILPTAHAFLLFHWFPTPCFPLTACVLLPLLRSPATTKPCCQTEFKMKAVRMV